MIVNQLRTLSITVKAGRTRELEVSGSYIKILSNTSSIDPVVSFDHGLASEIPTGLGFPTVQFSADKTTLEPAVFSSVQITAGPEDMTLKLSVALGGMDDSRSFIQGWVQVDMSAPYMTTPEAAAVAIDAFTILPSSNLIKERLVQNTGDYPIWWGDETTDPATKRGLRIDPFGTATINVRGVVYLKAQDGASTLSINNIMKG